VIQVIHSLENEAFQLRQELLYTTAVQKELLMELKKLKKYETTNKKISKVDIEKVCENNRKTKTNSTILSKCGIFILASAA